MAKWQVKVINGKEYWVRTSDNGNEIVLGDPMGDLAKAQAKAIEEVMLKEKLNNEIDRLDERENEKYRTNERTANANEVFNFGGLVDDSSTSILHEFGLTDEEI